MSGPFGATPWMYDHTDFYPLDINQSLKFNDDESQYLSWTPAAAGNRKTWTWSSWVKRGNIGSNQYLFQARIDDSSTEGNKVTFYFLSDNTIRVLNQTTVWKQTSAVFRDPSAWYHIVLTVDTTNSTATDRVKLYINGELASYSTSAGPSLNADLAVNSTSATHYIGQEHGGYSYFDGYLSDLHFIDGQALAPTNFGEFKESIWIPKVYNGTYGSNGFHLPFKNDDTVEGFNTVTYSGNGLSSGQSISGLGLSPDLVWLKERTNTSAHVLIDTVRGANIALESNNTNADFTPSSVGLASFDADGFTIGSANGAYNSGSDTYVGWCWEAGGAPTADNSAGAGATPTAGSVKIDGSNLGSALAGSIAATRLSANTARGFSIVTWTGDGGQTTVAHGLGATPKIVIQKKRNGTSDWWFYTTAVDGSYDYLKLNANDAKSDYAQTAPTSTTFVSHGWGSDTMVAYCFAEISGYSKISSYSGTGAAGNAVTTGFRPAFVMFKNTTDAGTSWYIHDATRDPYPPSKRILFPNENSAEFNDTGNAGITFTATGFTVDTTRNEVNGSGDTIIYMAFADTRDAAFWRDTSGNNNNWTPNNLDYRDSLVDSTTNNFNTTNVLAKSSYVNHSNGNLTVTGNTSTNNGNYLAFPRLTSGKYYYEQYINIASLYPYFIFNVSSDTFYYSNGGTGWPATSNVRISGSSQGGYTGLGASTGDIIGIAVDLDSGTKTVKIYKNNSLLETINITTSDAGIGMAEYNGSFSVYNFGQDSTFAGAKPKGTYTDANNVGSFQYAPPAGYLALCTANLPTPTIIDGSDYFNTLLWTGNGSNPRTLSGLDFTADLIWHKSRSSASMDHHAIQDVVRGFDTNNNLYTSLTAAETTYQNRGVINSVSSTGFTFNQNASDYSGADGLNQNNSTFVAWNWKAGTAFSNSAGVNGATIASTGQVNTTAGFSIVSYVANGTNTGTVAHGLSIEPKMVIQKNRDAASDWLVYTDLVDGSDDYLLLNSTAAKGNAAGGANATVFNSWDRTSGNNMIAYCFADVEGYSKVGSYTGNGNADGTFVYTGFRPALIILKRTDGTVGWMIVDNKRDSFNVADARLNPNSNGAEGTNVDFADYLSNGFKLRTSDSGFNASGGNYIYLAFAENPFKYSNAR